MDGVRSWLFLFLAGVAGAAYLWLSARNKQTPTSQSQPKVVEERSTDALPPQMEQDRTRPPIEVLYPGPTDTIDDAETDIIAVHGLGSSVDWSWTWKDGEKHINWLRDPDMLPAQVPKSRIMTYNYQSKWHKDAPKTRLQLCGEELIHSVCSFRSGTPKRPIVFVGHSLGGNVIIHALLHASDEEEYKDLLTATVGIVFLGTPLRGTKWQPFIDSLALLMGPAGSHRGITKELEFNGTDVRDKLHRFCRLRNRLSMPVSCFLELYETDYGRRHGLPGVVKGMIVDESSAYIDGLDRHTLQADHLKINKYSGPTDRGFLSVSGAILKMCADAKNVVRLRQYPKEMITDSTYALKYNPDAKNCLRDLFQTDPLEDRTALKRKKGDRAQDTCEWIMGTEELTAWLGSGQTDGSEATPALWLHGNPGTGKSTMAIFLTEELSEAFSATEGRTLAYFFCDSAFDTRKTATSVVRGLLLQLVQQHPQLLDYFLPKHQERGAEMFRSFDALWKIFMEVAADKATGRKYCIIDALDECDEESQEILLKQLKETFQGRNAPPNVHLLVTSRPYPEIREHMEEFANKDLASYAEAKEDIQRCIEERTTGLAKRKRYTEKVLTQVRDILRERAEGTFLWVGLACEELEGIPSKDAVRVLEDIPKGLSSLYQRLFEKAAANGDKDVKRVLSFVAMCLRPLSVLELSEACQLHLDEDDEDTRIQFMRDQIASCRLMVVIQDEAVLFLHQSVKDFLVKEEVINDLEAHAKLAYRCIDVLIKNFQSKQRRRGAFLDYAITEWPRHAHMAQSRFEIRGSLEDFFDRKSVCRESWLRSYRQRVLYDKIPRKFSILHVAAKWGILALVDHVCSLRIAPYGAEELVRVIDCRDGLNTTPLERAAESGHLNITTRLLELGAQVFQRVVMAAVRSQGNVEEIMALLLDRRGDQITITKEVVKAIADNRQHAEKVIALLLNRRGDQITLTEEIVKTIAKRLSYRIMKLLLNRRGDKIAITEGIVVATAGNRQHGKKMMTLLLDRYGDQITITEEVVKAAAGNWQHGEKIIALLLNRQADQITLTKEMVKTIAESFSYRIMILLLDRRGDQITITEEIIIAAAGNRQHGEKVMALLLDRRGDQITITEEVIIAAAGNRQHGEKVMTLLLDRYGDQITITEEVVKAAASNEEKGEEVMALLLDRRGDQITITEEVVKAAATCGQGRVLDLLSQMNGISVEEEWRFVAQFYNAAKAGHIQAIEELIRKGVKPDIENTRNVTPLWIAASLGNNAVVKLLAERKDVDVNSKSVEGVSPLCWAAALGNEDMVATLMGAGADPAIADRNRDTAIILARENEYERMAKMLEEWM